MVDIGIQEAWLAGIIPVLAFQSKETGAWHISSYAPEVNSRPTLGVLKVNARYYLWDGPGSTQNWALGLLAVGLVGVICFYGENSPRGIGWRRLLLVVLILWTVPVIYFLTHEVRTPYYLLPSVFGAAALLAFAVFIFDIARPMASIERGGITIRRVISFGVGLLPGLAVVIATWVPLLRPAPLPWYPHHKFSIPPDLANSRAWVWSDFESGAFWYYAQKPAFRIVDSDPSTRALLYDFVRRRGEPQYLIYDSPYMRSMMDEISNQGGVLERRPGGVDGAAYYLIHWPSSDPSAVGYPADKN